MYLAIFTICFGLIVYLYTKFGRKFELARHIPGPPFVPFLGNLQFIKLTAETLFIKLCEFQKQYKGCFRIWLGPNLWVFVHNPKDVKELLNKRELLRVDEFFQLHPLIGDGLLLLDGNRWSLHRKALTHAFNLSVLSEFLPAISRHADVLVSKLNKTESIEITDNLLLYVLDSICETSMGAHINAQVERESAYVEAFHNASHILFKRMSNPFLGPDWIFRLTRGCKKLENAIATLHALTESIIKEKRKRLNGYTFNVEEIKNRRRLVLLDVLLQCEIDGQKLSDREIKDHVNTFLFAGIDTTKSAISFLLYNIAKYKAVQDKIYQEIVSLIGSDPGQEISATYFADLPYLDKTINESLRIHTTVPVSARKNTEEITVGQYTYPKNTSLWINIFGMSHDPDIFENPNTFNPERFDDQEWLEKFGDYAYIPYSMGPRICIGKKYSIFIMKTAVIKLLLNYEIELTNPDEELQLLAEMVLKSKTGINLKFRKR